MSYVATRTRGKKELIYPVFQECSKLVEDEFWQSLYQDMSYGRLPKPLFILGENICNSNKRKAFTYNFADKQPQEIINDLHKLILENTNIYSNKDKNKKKLDLEKLKKNIQISKNVERFSMIKKKITRELLLINFVIDMKFKYKLSWENARNLLHIIQIGFIEKTISSADVILKSNKSADFSKIPVISKIKGLEYNKKLEKFENLNESKLDSETMVKEDVYLYKVWNKKIKKTKTN